MQSDYSCPRKCSRVLVVGLLLVGALPITYYFHGILHTGRIFTHLFYIPIILAALWWEAKGVLVAVFLSGLLLFSGLLLRPEPIGFNDVFRAAMLLAVALMVAGLRSRISAAETALAAQTTELSDKARKLQCLYGMTEIRDESGIDQDRLLQGIVELIRDSWKPVENVSVRILLGQREYKTPETSTAHQEHRFPIFISGTPSCYLAVGVLDDASNNGTVTLAQAERDLLSEVTFRLARFIEHEHARKELADHRDRLELLVGKRTAALRKANERLENEIAERRNTEKALADSEEKYRHLVENARDAIFIVQQSRIAFSNQRAAQMLESSSEALAGLSFFDLIDSRDRDRVSGIYAKRIAGEAAPETYSVRILTRNANTVWGQISAVRSLWKGSPCSLVFLRDISSQIQVEAKLRQAHTMEAVATLAGGIAHQFNNALSTILGNIELLHLDRPEDEGFRAYTAPIENTARGMACLVDQLLAHARGGNYCPGVLCPNEFVAETLSTLLPEVVCGTEVATDLGSDLPRIEADPIQLQMVLLDVVRNALEAARPSGAVCIRTESIAIAQQEEGAPTPPPGRYAVITVEDSGVGMDDDTVKRIFEPFFTTHFHGRGLGMAAAYGIVRNHGGWIEVDSELGKGTNVRLYLPAIGIAPFSEKIPPGSWVEVAAG